MEQKTREVINSEDFYGKHFKNHQDDWNALCVSMDTIGDTALAINHFQEHRTDNLNPVKKDFLETAGEAYLKLYGLLQAVILQQDAIKCLYEVIKKLDKQGILTEWKKYSLDNWNTLRGYRNLSSGHPVKNTRFKKGRVKRAIISRATISSKGFQLLVSDSSTAGLDFPYVSLSKLVPLYLSEAESILSTLESFLINYGF